MADGQKNASRQLGMLPERRFCRFGANPAHRHEPDRAAALPVRQRPGGQPKDRRALETARRILVQRSRCRRGESNSRPTDYETDLKSSTSPGYPTIRPTLGSSGRLPGARRLAGPQGQGIGRGCQAGQRSAPCWVAGRSGMIDQARSSWPARRAPGHTKRPCVALPRLATAAAVGMVWRQGSHPGRFS